MTKKPGSHKDDVHVMPNFGKPHESASGCWCGPEVLPDTLDRKKYFNAVWVHRVPQ